jgi:hypothetical protein
MFFPGNEQRGGNYYRENKVNGIVTLVFWYSGQGYYRYGLPEIVHGIPEQLHIH